MKWRSVFISRSRCSAPCASSPRTKSTLAARSTVRQVRSTIPVCLCSREVSKRHVASTRLDLPNNSVQRCFRCKSGQQRLRRVLPWREQYRRWAWVLLKTWSSQLMCPPLELARLATHEQWWVPTTTMERRSLITFKMFSKALELSSELVEYLAKFQMRSGTPLRNMKCCCRSSHKPEMDDKIRVKS